MCAQSRSQTLRLEPGVRSRGFHVLSVRTEAPSRGLVFCGIAFFCAKSSPARGEFPGHRLIRYRTKNLCKRPIRTADRKQQLGRELDKSAIGSTWLCNRGSPTLICLL